MTDQEIIAMLRRDGYHNAAERMEALIAENDHLRDLTKMMESWGTA